MKFLILLGLSFVCFLPASALTSPAPENRTWEIFTVGYDAQVRFLSADPLGHAASMDLYSYCQGDPLNYYDADGQMQSGFTSGWSGRIDADQTGTDTAFGIGLLFRSLQSGGYEGRTWSNFEGVEPAPGSQEGICPA